MHGNVAKITLLSLAALSLLSCGGGTPPTSESFAKVAEPSLNKAAMKKDDAPPTKAEPKPIDEKALPWTHDVMRAALTPGTKLVYKRTGTDAKGKKVDGKLTYLLRSSGEEGAGTSYTVEPDPGSNKASSMIATTPWSRLSPFFGADKVESTVLRRESVKVPAGEFTTSVVELKDFFGNQKTVWMVVDKPGIYAKVVDAGNAGDEKDKTELTLELESIEVGK